MTGVELHGMVKEVRERRQDPEGRGLVSSFFDQYGWPEEESGGRGGETTELLLIDEESLRRIVREEVRNALRE